MTTINVPPAELRHSWQRYFGINWDPGHIGDTLAGQMLFAGIYDGYVHQTYAWDHGLTKNPVTEGQRSHRTSKKNCIACSKRPIPQKSLT